MWRVHQTVGGAVVKPLYLRGLDLNRLAGLSHAETLVGNVSLFGQTDAFGLLWSVVVDLLAQLDALLQISCYLKIVNNCFCQQLLVLSASSAVLICCLWFDSLRNVHRLDDLHTSLRNNSWWGSINPISFLRLDIHL